MRFFFKSTFKSALEISLTCAQSRPGLLQRLEMYFFRRPDDGSLTFLKRCLKNKIKNLHRTAASGSNIKTAEWRVVWSEERNHCTFLHNEKRKILQCRGALRLSFNFQLIWKLGTSLWSQCSTASKTHIIKWRKKTNKQKKTNLKMFWNKNMDFFTNWRPAVTGTASLFSLAPSLFY